MIFKVSWFLTKFKEGGSHTLEFPTLHPPQSQPLFLIIQVQVRVATENLHIFSNLFLLSFFTVAAPLELLSRRACCRAVAPRTGQLSVRATSSPAAGICVCPGPLCSCSSRFKFNCPVLLRL